jgi:hypothetical protein
MKSRENGREHNHPQSRIRAADDRHEEEDRFLAAERPKRTWKRIEQFTDLTLKPIPAAFHITGHLIDLPRENSTSRSWSSLVI